MVIRRIFCFFYCMACIAVFSTTVAAQAPDGLTDAYNRIEVISTQITETVDTIDENNQNDDALLQTGERLKELDERLLEAARPLSERMAEVNLRLEQLGDAPSADSNVVELTEITQERRNLFDHKSNINKWIGEAERASILANKTQEEIIDLRRDLFFSTLSRRVNLSDVFSQETVTSARDSAQILQRKVASWFNFSMRYKSSQMGIAAAVSLLLALFLSFLGRRLFAPLIIADPTIPDPSYLSRLTVAFWSTFLSTLSITLFAFSTYVLFDFFGVLRADIAYILAVFMQFIVLNFFVYKLIYAILNPASAQWRILSVTNAGSRLLLSSCVAIAIVYGIDEAVSKIMPQLNTAYSVTVLFSFIAAIIIGIFMLIIAFTKPFLDENGMAKAWPMPAFIVLFAVGCLTLIISGIGYVSLSRFISQQVIVTGATLLAMYIGWLTGNAVSEDSALHDTALGRFFTTRLRMTPTQIDRSSLFMSLMIYALIFIIGIPLIMLQWGFQIGDILNLGTGLVTNLKIGSISISLVSVATAIFVFFLAFWFSRLFMGWMDGKILAKSRMDQGARTSIRTAIGYLGIGIAGLIAISVSGFDLSSLAIVAGALSLGIGFGLQNIVSNFVSGLILLAERPFKEGDWVVAGSVSGFVKKISVRATEIETFQRQTMIVPNSELINSTVGNWTHKNRLARIEIVVGVAYKSNPRQVRQILLDIIQKHEKILNFPEPQVAFVDFGASSLDFEVKVFLADVFERVDIETQIRMEIFEKFSEENIEFPFPQRDVNLKLEDAIRIKTLPEDAGSA